MGDTVVRLSKWVNGGRAVPQRVLMYPTNNCNLKCLFCYQQLQAYDQSDTVSKKRGLEIAEELCEIGIDN